LGPEEFGQSIPRSGDDFLPLSPIGKRQGGIFSKLCLKGGNLIFESAHFNLNTSLL
jgi:hypothetical protein